MNALPTKCDLPCVTPARRVQLQSLTENPNPESVPRPQQRKPALTSAQIPFSARARSCRLSNHAGRRDAGRVGGCEGKDGRRSVLIETSQPLVRPDGMRVQGSLMFVAENGAARVSELKIQGQARIRVRLRLMPWHCRSSMSVRRGSYYPSRAKKGYTILGRPILSAPPTPISKITTLTLSTSEVTRSTSVLIA